MPKFLKDSRCEAHFGVRVLSDGAKGSCRVAGLFSAKAVGCLIANSAPCYRLHLRARLSPPRHQTRCRLSSCQSEGPQCRRERSAVQDLQWTIRRLGCRECLEKTVQCHFVPLLARAPGGTARGPLPTQLPPSTGLVPRRVAPDSMREGGRPMLLRQRPSWWPRAGRAGSADRC